MVFNATFNNISAILWWSGLGQMPPDKSPLNKKPPNNEKYMLMFFVSNISVSLFNYSDM